MANLDEAARYYNELQEDAANYYQGKSDTISKGEVAERPTIVAGSAQVGTASLTGPTAAEVSGPTLGAGLMMFGRYLRAWQ